DGAAIAFTGACGGNSITTANNQNFAIMPNGTGSVGINTTSPTAKFDVNGTASGTVALSSLSTGIAHIGTGGVITSSAIDLASTDVTGLLPVNKGGSPFDQGS